MHPPFNTHVKDSLSIKDLNLCYLPILLIIIKYNQPLVTVIGILSKTPKCSKQYITTPLCTMYFPTYYNTVGTLDYVTIDF